MKVKEETPGDDEYVHTIVSMVTVSWGTHISKHIKYVQLILCPLCLEQLCLKHYALNSCQV